VKTKHSEPPVRQISALIQQTRAFLQGDAREPATARFRHILA
jgi:hypothetical protein